ncbi:prepilin-type N-terminal cleavage/methylation domain-containing protein [Vibrio sp. HN007]|uniref:type IV pilus modification PilV family protein n=1 Tax=Vibrio iocasae TaxID=3098914 RepID=UPI0035D50B71
MISGNRGIGLIEVLVALFILSFGVMSIFRLQTYMEQKASYAEKSVQALHIAESSTERLRISFLSNEQMQLTSEVERIIDEEFHLKIAVSEVIGTTADKQAIRVEAEVFWNNSRSETESIALSTILSRTNN